jgi:RNA polymerase sigma-70 factor (ECF subfamily)
MRDDEPLPANPRVTPATLAGLHADGFGWALTLTRGRRDEAEEVLHTTYLLICDGRARFDGRATFKTWLFGVIRNVARNRWRRTLLRRRFEQPATAETLEVPAADARAMEDALATAPVQAALERLPARQREVLDLVFRRDLTIEEAARAMGVSLGTARTHYERAKARLREALVP